MTTTTGDLTGARVDGRYRLDRLIARGGMADVYEAHDERLDRTVAVKMITAGGVAGFDMTAFADEARTIARLSHPNVVAVFDQGVHEGMPYVVMEYVAGTTLRDLLNRRRRLRIDEAVELCAQLLDGLQAAHDAGLVHRDIKPENILLKNGGRGDRVKVVDFGLAEAVHGDRDTGGPLVATAAYVAPELVNGKPATTASDVYSTAILLYELLTGEVPFDGPDSGAVARRHVEEDVPSPRLKTPDVPDGLADLVTAAAARRPGARPVDAGAFLRRLQAIDVAPAPGSTGKVPRPTRVVETTMVVEPPRTGRSWKAMLTLALIAALLVGVAAAGWWVGIGRYTSTPSLLDQTRETVAAYAEEAGFEVEIVDGYSATVPLGEVVSQEPGVGERIRRGAQITVVISLGPEQYQMPNVAGMSEDEAIDALAAVGVEPGDELTAIEREYSTEFPANEVVRTDPAAGEQVKAGTPVTVYVSDGFPPLNVPDVVGMAEDDAVDAVEAEGLAVGEVTPRYSDTIAEGSVIEQTPAADAPAGEGDTVDLVVSRGPEPVEVPDVVGMDIDDATEQLEDLGFEVKTAQIWFTGTVFDQSLDAGSEHPKGSEIWLWAR
ncbi:PASTA domain-containing protein [Glycomyces sp. TRM65418]|uniref:Stk1 family PASTA domain-containing Ser/Thr kinase n=1 Tax=Glycomyces sp. TRM65418 TaxID=2867006 RepID=UPI001CE5978E|nr:Stk1 family PASTA domain-containing Ser/Thr kinase [Glycomyces sp. TRM65418]MCC3762148.1 PASTA domain-containing protein [Glycomyces sp. TRM65418]QZD56212.1 PASTA domain-containing protein [Glycomyces sp. TRM65418]